MKNRHFYRLLVEHLMWISVLNNIISVTNININNMLQSMINII